MQAYVLHECTYACRAGLKRNERIETSSEKEKCTKLQRIQPDDDQYTGPKHVVVCTNLCDNI
jgi:hypothetical protein